MTFALDGLYIELIGLLKLLNIAETGGHAKLLVDEGLVFRNGEVELRKRAKLIPGDKITFQDIEIVIVEQQ
ncbi:MAG: RNA-binding S4 domain-containing protein [Bacteroidales bacterium]|nr:RNA-binding S4 domain-containing protein [Bacteroidales bacterium]